MKTYGNIEVRVFPYGDIFSWGREVGGGWAMPRNSSAAVVVVAAAPRKIMMGKVLRMGIWYSRNVGRVLGFMGMVLIY